MVKSKSLPLHYLYDSQNVPTSKLVLNEILIKVQLMSTILRLTHSPKQRQCCCNTSFAPIRYHEPIRRQIVQRSTNTSVTRGSSALTLLDSMRPQQFKQSKMRRNICERKRTRERSNIQRSDSVCLYFHHQRVFVKKCETIKHLCM